MHTLLALLRLGESEEEWCVAGRAGGGCQVVPKGAQECCNGDCALLKEARETTCGLQQVVMFFSLRMLILQ